MEWQPENEIVILQSEHAAYTYGLPVLQREESGNAESQVLECRFEAAPSARRRAASDVGVLGATGRSAGDERWNGTPRRFPEPECVQPTSLDVPYGIV
jgi:hypothetical protein